MRNQFLRTTWPIFYCAGSYAMTVSLLLINILNFSEILFPGTPYHPVEMGVLYSSGLWVSAFSTLLLGVIADRYSRRALFTIMMAGLGIGSIANAFVPQGQGLTTFSLFIVCNIVRGAFSGGLMPIVASFTNDALQKEERSKFFGVLNVVIQVTQIIGMISGAVFVQSGLWALFFLFMGMLQLASALFFSAWLHEPKRGLQQKELRDALASNDKQYSFKLTWATVRSNVLSRTNFYAILEGIFTALVLGIVDVLIIPYMQSPPHNISSVMTSLFMIAFGIPGALFGSIGFARLSDRYGKRHVKYRIYLLVVAIVAMVIFVNLAMFTPLANLDAAQGNDFLLLFSLPVIWMIGPLIFGARAMVGLYNINQPPILQEVNLPESQGLISSINNFTSNLGSATGPVLAGVLLATFNQGYQAVALICIPIGFIGAIFWLLATRRVDSDLLALSSTLRQRAKDLNDQGTEMK